MTRRQQREWPIILQVAADKKLNPEQTLMLLAIRDAENGPPGYEFGADDVRGTDLKTQAGSAAQSIKNNQARYQKLRQDGIVDQSFDGINAAFRRIVSIGMPEDAALGEDEEKSFMEWYRGEAEKRGLHPTPGADKYAYRAYWKAMNEEKAKMGLDKESGEMHYPSEYKMEGYMTPEEGKRRGFIAVPRDMDFVEYMGYYGSPTGYGYAPIHASDVKPEVVELNKNWSKNVRSYMEKYRKHFQEKGVKEDE